jgi:enamine deaminase RidA (YjgF/YER057c/UK114 family)
MCNNRPGRSVPYVRIPKNIFTVSPNLTDCPFPYRQRQRLVFVSGQVSADSNGKYLPVESPVTKKTHQIIRNVSGILGASGTSLDQVTKANVSESDKGNSIPILLSEQRTLTESGVLRSIG